MLDGVTVDQLRTFVAAVDEGSFSAAGRRLGRAQSVVSQTIATMEDRLGVALFERNARRPALTAQGRALVSEARAVIASMDVFKGRARRMADGLEPEIAITVDVMVPFAVVTHAAQAFEAAFPTVALNLSVEALGAAVRPVIDGTSVFAIAGPLATEPPGLITEPFPGVPMCAVVAHDHPLARVDGEIPTRTLAGHRQLVLADRSELSRGRAFGVLSPSVWRLSDLGAKLAFLQAGLGWGAMPHALVEPRLLDGSLVRLIVEDIDPTAYTMPMHAAWLAARPPGVAAAWLLERLRFELDAEVARPQRRRAPPARVEP